MRGERTETPAPFDGGLNDAPEPGEGLVDRLVRHFFLAPMIKKKLKPKKKEALAPGAAGQLQRPVWTKGLKSFESFAEANAQPGQPRIIKCVLITEGPGNLRDRNYYSRAAIEDAGRTRVFEGVRCFLDHQSEAERIANPVNKLVNLAGYFMNTAVTTVVGNDGVARRGITADLVVDNTEAGDELFNKARASVQYRRLYPSSTEVYAGLSINGGGKIDGTIDIGGDAWKNVVAFEGIASVDAVTRPARGGEFQEILESFKTPLHSGANMRLREMERKLRQIETQLLTESDAVKIAKLDEDKTELMKHIVSKVAQMPDPAAGGEPEEDEEGEEGELPASPTGAPVADGEEDEEAEMEAMRGAVKQKEGEAPDAYESRVKAACAAARGTEAKPVVPAAKPVESMSAMEFLKAYPKLAEAAKAAGVPVTVKVRKAGEEVPSKELTEAQSENQMLKAQLAMINSTSLAKRLLKESDMPEKFCPISTLVGKDEKAMREHIGSLKAILESVSTDGGPFVPAAGAKGPVNTDSITKELQEAGLLTQD